MKRFMAIDQYGQHYHNLKHPRKDLMDRIGCKHADNMYNDLKNGKVMHTGYVISGLWCRVYEVKPFKEAL